MPKEESFAQFMQRALFDPQRGYYSRNVATIGARGDFSTSATLSPLLGKAVSRWLMEQSRAQPVVRTVIEVGGGDGSLMRTVRSALGWWQRRRFDFCMVETSAVLREQQRRQLGGSVRWFDSIQAALDHGSGHALVYHNEFLDALPVTLIQWDASTARWEEVWLVHEADGRIKETLRPLSLAPECRADFAALHQWTGQTPPPSPRQRCELHTGVAQWLAALGAHWKSGAMLCIDYGGTFPALYHRRPNGTLRAYLLHQRLEGSAVYENAGRQDITTDINFTDLRSACARIGCGDFEYETQGNFIRRYLGDTTPGADEAGRFLVSAPGAGDAFQCLTVRRGFRLG